MADASASLPPSTAVVTPSATAPPSAPSMPTEPLYTSDAPQPMEVEPSITAQPPTKALPAADVAAPPIDTAVTATPNAAPSAPKLPLGGGGLKLGATKSKLGGAKAKLGGAKTTSLGAFAQEEDRKMGPLVPIEYTDEEKAVVAPPPKVVQPLSKEQLTALIKTIPTQREALYKESVDWDVVESAGIAEAKLRPFIAKKVAEYLGEEEPTLVEHVIDKIGKRTGAEAIEEAIAQILDDEAAVFVVKLWRMLLFEVKSYKATQEVP
uniref:PWI domain-containing protein n=1 Tax=Haptolina brevifila TaxID=156173 RepID=A0A7S2DHD5_9EUKA